MKLFTRSAAFILAMLLSLSLLLGCNGSPESTEGLSEPSAPTVSVTTSPENPVTSEPDEPEINIVIDSKNAPSYTLVRAEDASEELISAFTYTNLYIKDIVGDMPLSTDWEKPDTLPDTATEIVVGKTNRPATEKILSELRVGEFAIVYEGERIYILGKDDAATVEGLKYFRENYIVKSKKSIEFTNKLAYFHKQQYAIGSLKVEGVDILDYAVVIPSNADLFTKYAAENLADFVLANAGVEITVTTDRTAETEYEILIGKTSRAASSVNVTLKDGQYVLYKKGTKIVCLGNSYMVGGGVGALIGSIPTDKTNVDVNVSNIPTTAVASDFKFKEAKSAILMIGDGMGFNTVKMAKRGVPCTAGIGEFLAERLPYQCEAITSSLTSGATDSAASATALSSGYKTINGYLGVTSSGASKQNIRELAAQKGAKTAVITTDYITGATPGGFLVHHNDRGDTSIIQTQINKLVNSGGIDYCKGEVGDSLTDEAATALRKISAGGSSFFMMIEAAQIDKRSHANDYSGCITMVRRYNDVIAYVVEFVICHPDTALVITADHECGAITEEADGSFIYTSTNHSTANVPVYALGDGMESFNGRTVDNTLIPRILAKIYGVRNFGA